MPAERIQHQPGVLSFAENMRVSGAKFYQEVENAYYGVQNIWRREALYDGKSYYVLEYPRPDLGGVLPNRPLIYTEGIALARLNGLYEAYEEAIQAEGGDALIRMDCLDVATVLWQKWNVAAQGRKKVYGMHTNRFDIAVESLLQEAVSLQSDVAVVEQGQMLDLIIHKAARRTPKEIAHSFLHGQAVGAVVKLAGLSNPAEAPLTVFKMLAKPAHALYTKIVKSYNVYGSKHGGYDPAWYKVSVDESKFEEAYRKFAALYNAPEFDERVRHDGESVVLPSPDTAIGRKYMQYLAEIIYLTQLNEDFVKQPNSYLAAQMEHCNLEYLGHLIQQGRIEVKYNKQGEPEL